MTPDMLAFVIAAFCGFTDPKITKTAKLECSDYLVNCSVLQDGRTTNKQVDACKERWVEIARKK
jgi:hypothetical protein